MVDPMGAQPERPGAIEQKLDALTASVDARFDEVTSALVVQRQYTEFAFDRLRSEMQAGFADTQGRLGELQDGLETVTTSVGRLERKLDTLIDRVIGRPDP